MKLKYGKFNPSGNTTILVDNRQGILKREEYAKAAAWLMQEEQLCAEQVGYLEEATVKGALLRLHMMGGEFCGNATRCLAKMICDLEMPGIAWDCTHRECVVPVEVSGYPGILQEVVKEYEEASARVYGGMPLPVAVRTGSLKGVDGEVTFVEFDGILHIIIEGCPFSRELSKQLIENLTIEQPQLEAVGLMFYNREEEAMVPVVFVKEVGSIIYESSCGSGSTAVAAAEFEKSGKNVDRMKIRQPGGILEVSFTEVEGVRQAVLGGRISLVSRGTVWIEEL